MVERATGETLETYMSKNIWGSLHLKNVTFWPAKQAHMHERVADLSTFNATGKAVPLEGWDLINGSADCLGGGGVFATAQDFLALIKPVMVGDSKLLKEKSYEELFRPQLSEPSKQALQASIASAAGK